MGPTSKDGRGDWNGGCYVLGRCNYVGACYHGGPFSLVTIYDVLKLPLVSLFHKKHIGVNFARIFHAFITYRDEPGGPAAYFYHLSSFTNVFGSAIYIAQTLVGDGFVVSWFFHVHLSHLTLLL